MAEVPGSGGGATLPQASGPAGAGRASGPAARTCRGHAPKVLRLLAGRGTPVPTKGTRGGVEPLDGGSACRESRRPPTTPTMNGSPNSSPYWRTAIPLNRRSGRGAGRCRPTCRLRIPTLRQLRRHRDLQAGNAAGDPLGRIDAGTSRRLHSNRLDRPLAYRSGTPRFSTSDTLQTASRLTKSAPQLSAAPGASSRSAGFFAPSASVQGRPP